MHPDVTEVHRQALAWARFAFAASTGIAAIKFAAAVYTGSAAVLADALESLINIVTSAMVMRATALSAQPRDDDHPYGHGRVQYVAAAVEAALVGAAGGATVVIAVQRLVHPTPVENLDAALFLVALIGALTFAAGEAVRRAGRRLDAMAVEADGIHLRSDAITTFGSLVGLGLMRATGWQGFDVGMALVMGVWLLYTAFRVGKPALDGLMDAADPTALSRIADTLERARKPGWTAPHHVKTHRLGADVHVDLHLVLPRYWSLEQAHDVAEEIEQALNTEFGRPVDVMSHLEPCTDAACHECDIAQCPVRAYPCAVRPAWTAASITRRVRHVAPEEPQKR